MALAGCGYIGDPLPPALNQPVAVTDLRAMQFGDNILVQFTIPNLTTDNLPLSSVRSIELAIGPAASPFDQGIWLSQASRFSLTPTAGPIEQEIAARDFVGREIVIGTRAAGPTGRFSDWSNYAVLSVAPPLQRPANLRPMNTAQGVALTWAGSGPRYRVLRDTGTGFQPLGETETSEYVDQSTSYGAQYQYLVVAFSGDKQESLPSPVATITPMDTFPPAVPGGLSAVAGAQSIELGWTRNTETDFRIYNLFRSVDGGPFERIAEVDTPNFSDTRVESNHRYRYAVSAVDSVGNESERSEIIDAALP